MFDRLTQNCRYIPAKSYIIKILHKAKEIAEVMRIESIIKYF